MRMRGLPSLKGIKCLVGHDPCQLGPSRLEPDSVHRLPGLLAIAPCAGANHVETADDLLPRLTADEAKIDDDLGATVHPK